MHEYAFCFRVNVGDHACAEYWFDPATADLNVTLVKIWTAESALYKCAVTVQPGGARFQVGNDKWTIWLSGIVLDSYSGGRKTLRINKHRQKFFCENLLLSNKILIKTSGHHKAESAAGEIRSCGAEELQKNRYGTPKQSYWFLSFEEGSAVSIVLLLHEPKKCDVKKKSPIVSAKDNKYFLKQIDQLAYTSTISTTKFQKM